MRNAFISFFGGLVYQPDVSVWHLEPFDHKSFDFDDILGQSNRGCIVNIADTLVCYLSEGCGGDGSEGV